MSKEKKTKEQKKLEKQAKKQERVAKPFISAWGYVGYSVLWGIPVLGWLIWFFNLFSKKTNKRSYARSKICTVVFLFLVGVILTALTFVLVSLGISPELSEALKEAGIFSEYIEVITDLNYLS